MVRPNIGQKRMTSRAQSIAKSIGKSLQSEISEFGIASLVVCGGSSPIRIFEYLNSIKIDWHFVTIFLVDDRLVEPKSEFSNQKLLKTHLLQNNANKAIFIPLSTDLISKNLIPPLFTVMLLGMGNDGHFASLFPEMLVRTMNSSKCILEFEVSAEPSILTTPALGNPKLPRISMNLSLILKSKRIILLANGEEKLAVLRSAEKDKMLPVYYLLKQTHVPIEIESL